MSEGTEFPESENTRYRPVNSYDQSPAFEDTGGIRQLTSIRTKLILAVVLVSFVTASLITAMQVRTISRDILREAQLQAAALALPVQNAVKTAADRSPGSSNLHDSLRGSNAAQVEAVLADVLDFSGRNILAAYVIDPHGKLVLGKTRNQLLGDVPLSTFESDVKGASGPRTLRNGARYDTYMPCKDKSGQLIGYVCVGVPAQRLWDKASHLAAGTIISFAIISLITVSVLALWVSKYMLRPIKQITDNIAQSASDGQVHLDRLSRSGDEIGLLARVTNKVLPELYRQRRKLQETGAQLAAENSKLERTKWALMEMERRYRSAVEAATGVAYELDLATGKFIFLSRQVYDTVGYAAEDLPSSDVWTIHIHQDDRADAAAALQACASGQSSCFSRVYRFVCKDGNALQVVELGGLITDEAGKASRLSGIILPAHMVPKSLLATN